MINDWEIVIAYWEASAWSEVTVSANIPKSQFSISSIHEWEKKLRIPARTTFRNSNFYLFVNWEKLGSTA